MNIATPSFKKSNYSDIKLRLAIWDLLPQTSHNATCFICGNTFVQNCEMYIHLVRHKGTLRKMCYTCFVDNLSDVGIQ